MGSRKLIFLFKGWCACLRIVEDGVGGGPGGQVLHNRLQHRLVHLVEHDIEYDSGRC